MRDFLAAAVTARPCADRFDWLSRVANAGMVLAIGRLDASRLGRGHLHDAFLTPFFSTLQCLRLLTILPHIRTSTTRLAQAHFRSLRP